MPMTRELKKRLMGIDDRIGKLENKGPSQQTNGQDLGDSPGDVESRLNDIEAVLQIPGDKVRNGVQVLSAWRQIIENKLGNIETVLVMPGPDGFLSGFADKVDKAITGVKEQVRELHEKWKPLFNVGKWIDKTEGRLKKLEQVPDPASDVTTALETQVRDLQTRSRMLTKEMNDNRPTLKKHEDRLHTLEQVPRGQPVIDWIKNTDDRLHELEVKPVAGTLSNIAQEMQMDTEGNTEELKALRSLVLKAIWIVSAILAVMTVAQFLTNVLP